MIQVQSIVLGVIIFAALQQVIMYNLYYRYDAHVPPRAPGFFPALRVLILAVQRALGSSNISKCTLDQCLHHRSPSRRDSLAATA